MNTSIIKTERDVLKLLEMGGSPPDIAKQLGVKLHTVVLFKYNFIAQGHDLPESEDHEKHTRKARFIDLKILKMLNSGMIQADIARQLNMPQATVSDIKKKLLEWGYEIIEVLSDRDQFILEQLSEGMSFRKIAAHLGCSHGVVNKTKKRFMDKGFITSNCELTESYKKYARYQKWQNRAPSHAKT